jgi:alkaline phosphatase D
MFDNWLRSASVLLVLGCRSPAPDDPPPTTGPPRAVSAAPNASAVAEEPAVEAPAGFGTPQGIAVGEVSEHDAVIWSRTVQRGAMHARVSRANTSDKSGSGEAIRRSVTVGGRSDFAGRILVAGLEPATEYRYQVWFASAPDESASPPPDAQSGSFRTAPARNSKASVHFGVGGDLGGQNACRDKTRGYPIFGALVKRHYDFFIALGDLVYADAGCTEHGRYGNEQIPNGGQAKDLDGYYAHWRYNRSDPGQQAFLASTSLFAVWDDHEVLNDFGPATDTRDKAPYFGAHMLPIGKRAFLDYNPVRESAPVMYRAFHRGQHVDLFVLDTRSYRDDDALPDSPEKPKTLLGKEQFDWLIRELTASRATWKFVVSSVPLSIPTGSDTGYDGWASEGGPTGFEAELQRLLSELAKRRTKNLVFLSTDVHFASALEYRPFDDRPEFVFHELVSGPMAAGIFPRKNLDASFRPRRLFYWREGWPAKGATYEQALEFFNAGEVHVSDSGTLSLSIVTAMSKVVYEGRFEPK